MKVVVVVVDDDNGLSVAVVVRPGLKSLRVACCVLRVARASVSPTGFHRKEGTTNSRDDDACEIGTESTAWSPRKTGMLM